MPTRFSIDKEIIADLLRMEISDVVDLIGENKTEFVYKHMNNGSGICPECAPWLGMQTTGTGSDGVPVPPLHPRCKCFLMRADVARMDDIMRGVYLYNDMVQWDKHFSWMKTLSRNRLATIVGKIRAHLVFKGELQIEDLYEGIHLKSLHDLGYTHDGFKASAKMSAVDVLSSEDYYSWLEAFHTINYNRLPKTVRGDGAGSSDGVALMLVTVIPYQTRSGRVPKWVRDLLVLLREILPSGALLSE